MKATQIRDLSIDELNTKLEDLKKELFNLRLNLPTGQVTNPMQLKLCKKDIARVKTIIRERELNNSSAKKA